MKILNDIFIFFGDRISYSAAVYLSSILALFVSVFYGFIFLVYAFPLTLGSISASLVIQKSIIAACLMQLAVVFILSGWKRFRISPLLSCAAQINRFYDSVRKREEISNDELINSMKALIYLPQRNMYLSLLSVFFVLLYIILISGIENFTPVTLKISLAGCGSALYMYALFVYSTGDMVTNFLRKKGFKKIFERGMILPNVYGFSFRKKVILLLGFLMFAVLSMLYLITYTHITFNHFLIYFVITALVIILLVLVYVFPLVNVFYHVLNTTGRLSMGDDTSLVVGNNEKEILTFAGMFNRSLAEFVYLRKNLEIKVKERTELLEKRNRELFENEEKFRVLTDSVQDAIIMMDNDGKVSYWNRAAELIFGYSSLEIIGRPLHEILAPKRHEEIFQKKFPDFKRFGKGLALGKRVELSAVRKNGQEFPVELSLSAFLLDYKWHAVGIVRDITERKDYEHEIYKAKKAAESANRAKSEFLANMSHEIRTPMSGILGFSEIIKQECPDPAVQEKADIIYRSGTGLLELINDILDLSKIEAGRMEVKTESFDLYELIRQTHMLHSIVAEKKGLASKLSIDDSLPRYIVTDAKKLQQVIANLLSNAIKFTERGSVALRAETISWQQEDVVVKVSVEDTGIGIPADSMEKIFKTFEQSDNSTTRHYEGTGLGLAIARSFVEMLGGHIWVESEKGRGARFEFIFKARQGTEEGVLPSLYDTGNEPCLDGTRFLVLDPDANSRILLYYMLKGASADVEIVDDPAALYNRINEIDITGLFIDHSLMNDGEGCLGEVLKNHPESQNLIIVAMQPGLTAGPGDGAEKPESDAFLEKPFTRKSLYLLLHKLFPAGEAKVKNEKNEASAENSPEESAVPGVGREIIVELKGLSLDRSSDRKKALEIIDRVQQAGMNGSEELGPVRDAIDSFEYDLARKLITKIDERSRI